MAISTPSENAAWVTEGGQIVTALNNFEGTDAEYQMSSNQTISASTNTIVSLGTTNKACSLVTRSTDGAGHRFTLSRAGVWLVDATIRWVSGTGGERYVACDWNENGQVASSSCILGTFTGPVTHHLTVCRYFAASDYFRFTVFQSSTGNRTLLADNGGAWGRVYLAWVHP